MAIRNFIATVVLVLMCAPAHAGFYTGNDLIPLMREAEKADRGEPDTDYTDAFAFSGYVKGVADALHDRNFICANNTTSRQVMAVVRKYLNDNPAKWADPASDLIYAALHSAFPCD